MLTHARRKPTYIHSRDFHVSVSFVDAEWFKRVAAAGLSIEKRSRSSYVVLDAKGKVVHRAQRKYQAQAFVSRRVGLELKAVEGRVARAAAELVARQAETHPLDSPPQWSCSLPAEPGHVVYRALGCDGRVLYVGVTVNIFARMAAHRARSPWWGEADRIDWAGYDTRSAAEDAEAQAIRRHRPPWNVIGLPA